MKVQKLLIGLIAMSSLLLSGCGSTVNPGELPGGGREIDNSKAVMRLASTMTELDKVDNIGLSLNSNIDFTHEDNTNGSVRNEYIKVNDINATVKFNGLTSATKSSEIKASAEFGFDLDVKTEEVIKQNNSKIALYLSEDKAYYDFSKAGEEVLKLIELPKEGVTQFYAPLQIFEEETIFPLFNDNYMEENVFNDVSIDYSYLKMYEDIITSKQYDDGRIAIAINLTPETYSAYWTKMMIEEAKDFKESNAEFDLETEIENINKEGIKVKEEFAEDVNYIKATLVFNDNYIEEISFAVDCYLTNDKATEDKPTYEWTHLKTDLSIRVLTGNDAMVKLPDVTKFEELSQF